MSLVLFDDRDGFIWYEGRFIPWRDARLHGLTHLQLPTISASSSSTVQARWNESPIGSG